MRILVAGDWQWDVYEKSCSDALARLGHEVIPFRCSDFFRGRIGRLQCYIPFPGPALAKLNFELAKLANDTKPEVILVWRGIHVLPVTLRKIKQNTQATIVTYNNDDPFGPAAHDNVPWHHHFKWFWYIRTLKHSDLALVYRPVNVGEAKAAGAKRLAILKPYFIPELNRPVKLTEQDRIRYGCDVVFVGHYEPDGREEYLRQLVDAGLHVRLFGGGDWTRSVLGDLTDYFGEVSPVFGDDYAKALCGAKMCLCFLSKLNRDTYTRRCFEIPACGRLLLSERTEDLQRLFKEDEEAVFFTSPEELTGKALLLRDHAQDIERIAEAGMRRVHADGHTVYARMKEFLDIVNKVRAEGIS